MPEQVTAHWFRHGLRLHDNPALIDGANGATKFFAFFAFDGQSGGTKGIGYNRMKFLCESLDDLDANLRKLGGRLWVFQQDPCVLLSAFKSRFNLTTVSFERDSEAVWRPRDEAVERHCSLHEIDIVERVSLTLWDPARVLDANGGEPPLTFTEFARVAESLGSPPRPVGSAEDLILTSGNLEFLDLLSVFAGEPEILDDLGLFPGVPKPEDLGVIPEYRQTMRQYKGGETQGLNLLKSRLQLEKNAFRAGYTQPTHTFPDLVGAPLSLSPHLRHGTLSVRKFYWDLLDLHKKTRGSRGGKVGLGTQLIWREYFYCMSTENDRFDQIEGNKICLPIPWSKDEVALNAWKLGKTGFPFIDAAMRQLRQEGWIHHVARNATALFLTRGALWISWEEGVKHFLHYLLDGDWSVCSGNWLWLSSSSFERLLDCSECFSPSFYGRKLDPTGEFVKRYVPELSGMPLEYLHEPWLAPKLVQEKARCVLGEDYPRPMVDFGARSRRNCRRMENFRKQLGCAIPRHCAPSSAEEARDFMWSTAADNVFAGGSGHHCNHRRERNQERVGIQGRA